MLNADRMKGFVEAFLWERFHERQPISPLHYAYWKLVTDPYPFVAFAGPRGSAKTTAVNHCWGLADALFGVHAFQLKVSKTYDLACERIMAAKQELRDNEALRAAFNIKVPFERDREEDFICELSSGYKFRMAAMGMDQAKRGISWGTMRPGMIQVDDGEDDVEVLNPETRKRTMLTVLRVLIPMMGDDKCIRIYGTILHQDSMLAQFLANSSWKSARFELCDDQVSESSLLWPERFSRKQLLALKTMYADAGELDTFNREYRNVAINEETSFFRSEDFRPMGEDDHKRNKLYYVGGDLAISKKEHRDYTVFYVGGLDEDGILHIVDERRGRWDGKEIIDEMYSINEAWHPEEWFIEGGAIKTALGAALDIRMAEDGYLNLAPDLLPTKDKATRAMPFQARMRGKGVRWDTDSSWFADAKQELLAFSQEGTRGSHDDRVDAAGWLGIGLKRMGAPMSAQEQDRADMALWRRQRQQAQPVSSFSCTGYEFYRQQSGF